MLDQAERAAHRTAADFFLRDLPKFLMQDALAAVPCGRGNNHPPDRVAVLVRLGAGDTRDGDDDVRWATGKSAFRHGLRDIGADGGMGCEKLLRHADGSVEWYEVAGQMHPGETGEPAMFAVLRNTTRQQHLSRAVELIAGGARLDEVLPELLHGVDYEVPRRTGGIETIYRMVEQ